MQKSAYTINEAVSEIGIGRSKLYGEIKARKITVRKIGRKSVILCDEIQRYLECLPKKQLSNN